jgi:hypothetical protein
MITTSLMRHVDTILSLAGANSSAFFPRRKSATTILKLHLSNKAIQILSGNSFLNSHQHRFGFKNSPACGCDSPLEPIEHFFYCPPFLTSMLSFPRCPYNLVTYSLIDPSKLRCMGSDVPFYPPNKTSSLGLLLKLPLTLHKLGSSLLLFL